MISKTPPIRASTTCLLWPDGASTWMRRTRSRMTATRSHLILSSSHPQTPSPGPAGTQHSSSSAPPRGIDRLADLPAAWRLHRAFAFVKIQTTGIPRNVEKSHQPLRLRLYVRHHIFVLHLQRQQRQDTPPIAINRSYCAVKNARSSKSVA